LGVDTLRKWCAAAPEALHLVHPTDPHAIASEPSTLRAAFQAATPIDLTPFWERWRNTAA